MLTVELSSVTLTFLISYIYIYIKSVVVLENRYSKLGILDDFGHNLVLEQRIEFLTNVKLDTSNSSQAFLLQFINSVSQEFDVGLILQN